MSLVRIKRRRYRVRRALKGRCGERPRLSVFRSARNIYVQVIDDKSGRTLAQASTLEPDVKAATPYGGNVTAAVNVGTLIAERAGALGVAEVVFDRGGYLFHGRVKALAEAAREGGLSF